MRRRVVCAAVLAVALVGEAGADPAPPNARASDGVDAVAPRPSFEQRVERIRLRVQAAAGYPALAQLRRLEGRSVVGFEIGSDGKPLRVELIHSAGFPQLDRAATRAVLDAAPLPWVYGRLELPVRFELGRDSP